MPLTDTKVKQAKPKEESYRIYDQEGLYVQVQPNGSKYWRLKYRFNSKENIASLGIYAPGKHKHLSLKEARKKSQAAKTLIEQGIDPNRAKAALKATKEQESLNTFSHIAEMWFDKQFNNWAPATAKKNRALLDNDLLPYLKQRPITDIETWELVSVLNRIVDRGAIDTAHKCRQILNQICRFAKQAGMTKHNPATDLEGVLPQRKVKHRAAITDPATFAHLLVDIDQYRGSHITRTMLALAPLLFQRPGELAAMEWEELDLENAYWHIPQAKKKERNKSEGDHLVPLPKQAVALINDIKPLTGHRQYVFPNQRNPKTHANPESINKALRIMGYDTGTQQCFHGFRASARTMLDEQLGLRVEWIEHQLAHTVKDPLGRAYNRTKHLPERIDMMERWGNYLDKLKKQALSGNVITADFARKASEK